MSWVAAAAAGGAVVSGALQADAAGSAADAQSKAAGQSIGEQRRQFDLTRADNAPFLGTGTQANRRLAMLLGLPQSGPDENDPRFKALMAPELANIDKQHMDQFGMSAFDPRADANGTNTWITQAKKRASDRYAELYGDPTASDPASGSLLRKFSQSDMEADPVYQSGLKFGADQGRDAINARATSGGMYDSGATLKALTRFGNDYGSTKANESFNRYNTQNDSIFNKLSGVSGTGQVATGQVAAAGANMANNVGASLEGAGNARAAGIVGGANAWGGAINNVAGAMNNYQSNQRLNALLARYPGGGSGSSYGGSPYGSNSSDYGYYG